MSDIRTSARNIANIIWTTCTTFKNDNTPFCFDQQKATDILEHWFVMNSRDVGELFGCLTLHDGPLEPRLYRHCSEFDAHDLHKGKNFTEGYTSALEDIMNVYFPEIKPKEAT